MAGRGPSRARRRGGWKLAARTAGRRRRRLSALGNPREPDDRPRGPSRWRSSLRGALRRRVLAFRGHREGPVAAVPAAAYAAYMFIQYVVGPQYLEYRPIVALHLGIFVLSGGVLSERGTGSRSITCRCCPGARNWFSPRCCSFLRALLSPATHPRFRAGVRRRDTRGVRRRSVDVLVDLPARSRCRGTGHARGRLGLVRGAAWARKAVYGIVGWFALVPISVSAMSITMVLNDDPNAAVGNAVGLGVVALLFTAVAAWLYRPLLQS